MRKQKNKERPTPEYPSLEQMEDEIARLKYRKKYSTAPAPASA